MPQPAEILNMVMNIVLFSGIKATVLVIPSAEFQRLITFFLKYLASVLTA